MNKAVLPQTILFDLDGTLIDTAPDFIRVVNRMRTDARLSELPKDLIRSQVSNGARSLTALAFGDEQNNPHFQQQLNELLNRYLSEVAVDSRLFPGLDSALKRIEQHGIPWGIVTNKPSRFTHPLLQGLQLDQRCAVAICPDDVTHRKPDPEPIYLACERLGVKAKQSVYVGDHARDIEAGRRAGCVTIAAGWGYLNEGEQVEHWLADFNHHRTEDFTDWLDGLLN